MSITEGNYYIVSSEFGHREVSRAIAEDKSLLPKAIWALPIGARAHGSWKVKEMGDGEYELVVGGTPTGIDRYGRGPLAFFIRDMAKETGWHIERVSSGYISNDFK
ncbi:hypothetical protein ABW21_db0201530 [Orbilia brochopaga]|nr:hypothetical protein ABW21_db0201530 [Drechslerella brochopaga]